MEETVAELDPPPAAAAADVRLPPPPVSSLAPPKMELPMLIEDTTAMDTGIL